MIYLLNKFKRTSDYLQNVDANMAECLVLINSLKTVFQEMRADNYSEINNSMFNKFFLDAINISKENNITIPNQNLKKTKRTKKMPVKYNQFIFTESSSLENLQILSKNDIKIHLFVSTLDYIIYELEERFTNNSSILSSISYLHPQNENFLSYELLKPLALHYNLDLEMLLSELKILPTTIKKYEIQFNIKINSLMNLVDLLEKYKIVFNEIYKLAIISITIPVSSAACERTFLCLRRLKNYMRNRMTNDRLVNLSCIFIEKKLAKNLDMNIIVEKFAYHKNRKII